MTFAAGQTERVNDRGEHTPRTRRGLTESTKVQPDDIAFGGERRPERIPHPAIGDTGMDEDDWQVTVGTRTVVGDTGGRV